MRSGSRCCRVRTTCCFPPCLAELRALGGGDIPVLAGGVIPEADIPALKAQGIREVFTPGASLAAVVAAFEEACRAKS